MNMLFLVYVCVSQFVYMYVCVRTHGCIRVYDKALANAVMQQAAIILQVEESMPHLRRFYDNQHIHRHCAPLGEFYDDDISTDPRQHEEMKTLTAQIKVTHLGQWSCIESQPVWFSGMGGVFVTLFLEYSSLLQETLDEYINIQKNANTVDQGKPNEDGRDSK